MSSFVSDQKEDYDQSRTVSQRDNYDERTTSVKDLAKNIVFPFKSREQAIAEMKAKKEEESRRRREQEEKEYEDREIQKKQEEEAKLQRQYEQNSRA